MRHRNKPIHQRVEGWPNKGQPLRFLQQARSEDEGSTPADRFLADRFIVDRFIAGRFTADRFIAKRFTADRITGITFAKM